MMKTVIQRLETALADREAFAGILLEIAELPTRDVIALSKAFYGHSARTKRQALDVIRQRQHKLLEFVEGA